MKRKTVKITLLLTSLSLLLIGANSCDNTQKKPIVAKVKCTGTCNKPPDGSVSCSLNYTEGGNSVYCSCSGCEMIITDKDGKVIQVNPTDSAFYQVNFLSEFKKSMEEKFPYQSYSITSIEINKVENDISELYSYRFSNEESGTILFASIAKDKTTKVIDCKGTCDCREMYNFNTNSASCTCADCTMSITESKK